MLPEKLERGLTQVFTGNGKGKTTAAMGLAMRALGHGLKVYVIQFLKGSMYTGEIFAAERLSPFLKIVQFGHGCPYASLIKEGLTKCTGCGECFYPTQNPARQAETRELIAKGFNLAKEVIRKGEHDLVILDELNVVLGQHLLDIKEVLSLIKNKPFHVEVVLTGRGAPEEIIGVADLVTEFKEVKHPYQQGIPSRWGIEY